MAKRGRCRCGTILVFQPTARGYKTRCAVCQSIVRLRVDAPVTPQSPAPIPVVPAFPSQETPVDLGMIETHESSAPRAEAEMPAYRDPEPTPVVRRLWLLIPLAVAVAVVALAALALLVR